MSITLNTAYRAELKNPNRRPDTYIQIDASTTVKIGYNMRDSEVVEGLMEVSDVGANTVDPAGNFTTMGEITFVLTGRDSYETLINDNFLIDVTVKLFEGFVSNGYLLSNYVQTYEGKISDYNISDDKISFKVADIQDQTRTKVPVLAEVNQYRDLTGLNPADIMNTLLVTDAGIAASLVDSAQIAAERDLWFNGWEMGRFITDSKSIKEHLTDLQISTNSNLFFDGAKTSLKAFAPTPPGLGLKELNMDLNILKNSIKYQSGYKDFFFNQVEIYFDYDESGSDDKSENYESKIIINNNTSQTDWGRIKTHTIKSKWIRTLKVTQPTMTGVKIYYMSIKNEAGSSAELSWTASTNTMTYKSHGGTVGEGVKIEENGKFTVFDNDKKKYVKLVVDFSALPVGNITESQTSISVSGSVYAKAVANRLINRFSSPVPPIKLELDFKDVDNLGSKLAPTDTFLLTSDRIVSKDTTYDNEQVMVTKSKINPKTGRVSLEVMATKLSNRAGWIAPNGQPDYVSASTTEREYCYIGRASDNKVFDGINWVDGYLII